MCSFSEAGQVLLVYSKADRSKGGHSIHIRPILKHHAMPEWVQIFMHRNISPPGYHRHHRRHHHNHHRHQKEPKVPMEECSTKNFLPPHCLRKSLGTAFRQATVVFVSSASGSSGARRPSMYSARCRGPPPRRSAVAWGCIWDLSKSRDSGVVGVECPRTVSESSGVIC